MVFWIIGQPQNVNQLKAKHLVTNENARAKIKIAVIDDQDFSYLDILKKHGYQLTHFHDIESIDTIELYPLILCDIKGVGKFLNSKAEGAHLIKEINIRYPHKYIIAYTTLTNNLINYSQADKTLNKDIDQEEWIENLDAAIDKINTPYFWWTRIRKRLISEEIPLSEIIKLEDQFVSYANHKVEEFPSKKLSTHFPDKAKSLLSLFVKTYGALRG